LNLGAFFETSVFPAAKSFVPVLLVVSVVVGPQPMGSERMILVDEIPVSSLVDVLDDVVLTVAAGFGIVYKVALMVDWWSRLDATDTELPGFELTDTELEEIEPVPFELGNDFELIFSERE